MNSQANEIQRVALTAEIARRQPGIGRTAMMKYMYLLQVVREVPLGYRFQLYAYGPYDFSVLSTIGMAEHWGAIVESGASYDRGYKQEIRQGNEAERLKPLAESFLDHYEKDISWVTDHFRNYTAAGMESVSTMVFADREALDGGERLSAPSW